MEEQRIVRPRIFDQPMHRAEDVGLGRLAHWILLIIGQEHHVLALVVEVLVEVSRHVLNIVDASSKLPSLTKIVDANQQRLPSAATIRVLELIALRRTVAKILHLCWRRWWCSVAASAVSGLRRRATVRRALARRWTIAIVRLLGRRGAISAVLWLWWRRLR